MDGSDAQLAQTQLERARHTELNLEGQMRDVSAILDLVAEKLAEQQDSVQSVLDDAIEARSNVRAGNKELQEANDRPSTLRDFVVCFLLLITAVLWFLDWY